MGISRVGGCSTGHPGPGGTTPGHKKTRIDRCGFSGVRACVAVYLPRAQSRIGRARLFARRLLRLLLLTAVARRIDMALTLPRFPAWCNRCVGNHSPARIMAGRETCNGNATPHWTQRGAGRPVLPGPGRLPDPGPTLAPATGPAAGPGTTRHRRQLRGCLRYRGNLRTLQRSARHRLLRARRRGHTLDLPQHQGGRSTGQDLDLRHAAACRQPPHQSGAGAACVLATRRTCLPGGGLPRQSLCVLRTRQGLSSARRRATGAALGPARNDLRALPEFVVTATGCGGRTGWHRASTGCADPAPRRAWRCRSAGRPGRAAGKGHGTAARSRTCAAAVPACRREGQCVRPVLRRTAAGPRCTGRGEGHRRSRTLVRPGRGAALLHGGAELLGKSDQAAVLHFLC